jgi:hypothetical protein
VLHVDGTYCSTWAGSRRWLSHCTGWFRAQSLSQLWRRRVVSSRGSDMEYGGSMMTTAQRNTLGELSDKWTGKCSGLCCHWGEWDWEVKRLMQLLDLESLSRNWCDSRTQTEGPSPYWYSLNSTNSQANTTSSHSRKTTNTESTCSSATDTSSTGNCDRTP